MTRREYYGEATAPRAHGLLAAAFGVVRDSRGQVLLVRRADDSNWELPGGRIEVGESASQAAVREVGEETSVAIRVTRLSGVYSEPRHVLDYQDGDIRQQLAVCFHAVVAEDRRDPPRPDDHEVTAAAWFEPQNTTALDMHPAMRRRLTDALLEPDRAHFD